MTNIIIIQAHTWLFEQSGTLKIIPKAKFGKFQLAETAMSIYPSLVNQNEAIQIDGMESDTRIQITSLDGKVIKNEIIPSNGKQTAQYKQNLGSGIYIVNLTNMKNAQTSSHKILVK